VAEALRVTFDHLGEMAAVLPARVPVSQQLDIADELVLQPVELAQPLVGGAAGVYAAIQPALTNRNRLSRSLKYTRSPLADSRLFMQTSLSLRCGSLSCRPGGCGLVLVMANPRRIHNNRLAANGWRPNNSDGTSLFLEQQRWDIAVLSEPQTAAGRGPRADKQTRSRGRGADKRTRSRGRGRMMGM
jgi:hypothetical protein